MVPSAADGALAALPAAALLAWACAGGNVPALSGRSPSSLQLTARKFAHGQSNPTYHVRATAVRAAGAAPFAAEFVLRARPPPPLLPSAHRLDREHAVYAALAATGVPVPAVWGYCGDAAVIGVEFYAMEYVRGRVFQDVALPRLAAAERRAVYSECVRVLRLIAGVDARAVGLAGATRPGGGTGWAERQVTRWTAQFRRSAVDGGEYGEMERLIGELERVYCGGAGGDGAGADGEARLVQGDFRLDNCIFHAAEPRILAVIDWELWAVGDPVADLATFLVPFHVPSAALLRAPRLAAVVLPHPRPPGVPTEAEIVRAYGAVAGGGRRLLMHVALALFRLASICYGVAARARAGNASSKEAAWFGATASILFVRAALAAVEEAKAAEAADSGGSVAVAVSGTLQERVARFLRARIAPLERSYGEHVSGARRWDVWAPMEGLKCDARAAGLWNLWLPKAVGGRLTAAEYAPLAELMGRVVYAAECFNCSAPDTGNMDLLARFGTDAQKARWLQPLLDGEIRSCFAMTEPGVASSDPTNLAATVARHGGSLVVNGRKWWTSGAMDPRCKLILFLGCGPGGGSGERRHGRHTIVLIPMEAPGVKIVRHMSVFGFDDAPHGHAEMEFKNVIVQPRDAVLLGEGRGFEAAQSRLGGGRLHHCMRVVGLSERALEVLVARAERRSAFGRALVEHGVVLQQIAQSRCDVEQARQAVHAAAAAVDGSDVAAARRAVAIAKVVVPRLASNVLDRAIQVHGGAGVSQDTMLAMAYAHVRSLRLADGPDEVHLSSIAKLELATQRMRAARL
jgi:alkylation response protein AidB-like acyl-CoA dehydrogenase/aminoglycoside phosphotransferase (APT) family kinase protein